MMWNKTWTLHTAELFFADERRQILTLKKVALDHVVDEDCDCANRRLDDVNRPIDGHQHVDGAQDAVDHSGDLPGQAEQAGDEARYGVQHGLDGVRNDGDETQRPELQTRDEHDVDLDVEIAVIDEAGGVSGGCDECGCSKQRDSDSNEVSGPHSDRRDGSGGQALRVNRRLL